MEASGASRAHMAKRWSPRLAILHDGSGADIKRTCSTLSGAGCSKSPSPLLTRQIGFGPWPRSIGISPCRSRTPVWSACPSCTAAASFSRSTATSRSTGVTGARRLRCSRPMPPGQVRPQDRIAGDRPCAESPPPANLRTCRQAIALRSYVTPPPSSPALSRLRSPPRPSRAARRQPPVRPGVEVLLADSLHLVRGQRVGLVTNHTGRGRDGTPSIDLLADHPEVELVALYSPEHGIRGSAEAGERVASGIDERTGLPVHSLYGETVRPHRHHARRRRGSALRHPGHRNALLHLLVHHGPVNGGGGRARHPVRGARPPQPDRGRTGPRQPPGPGVLPASSASIRSPCGTA